MPKSRTQFAAVGSSPLPTPRLALSIPEFCKAHGISEGFFYKLKKQGEGPREMKVGARTLISFESAAEWRRAREAQHNQDHREAARSVQSGDAMAEKDSSDADLIAFNAAQTVEEVRHLWRTEARKTPLAEANSDRQAFEDEGLPSC
jgi:predicted DNA-binding transcriptional regulator AlpA